MYLKENVWPENKAESKGHLSEESRQKAEHNKVTNNRASEMARWIKEFGPQDPHHGGERITSSCPLTSTHVLWHVHTNKCSKTYKSFKRG